MRGSEEARASSGTSRSVAGIGVGLVAIDVLSIAPVVRRRQERKLLRDAVGGYVESITDRFPVARAVVGSGTGCIGQEVDPVTNARIHVQLAARHAGDDVGDVVVGPPTIGVGRRQQRVNSAGETFCLSVSPRRSR